jgi:hypothetical protein
MRAFGALVFVVGMAGDRIIPSGARQICHHTSGFSVASTHVAIPSLFSFALTCCEGSGVIAGTKTI